MKESNTIKVVQTNLHRFTKEEKNLIFLLRRSTLFISYIKRLRKAVGIPENGFPIKDFGVLFDDPRDHPGAAKILVGENEYKFASLIGILLDVLRLPLKWQLTLIQIALFNCAIPPDPQYGPVTIKFQEHSFNSDKELHIVIRENLSFNRLIEMIKLRQKDIEEKIKELPSSLNRQDSNPNIAKIQNVEIYDRLLDLRNAGFSLNKIANALNSEEGRKMTDVSFEVTKQSVSEYSNSYQAKIDKLSDSFLPFEVEIDGKRI